MVAGYRGTTHEQDSRWKEKERKIMKDKEWPEEFKQKVDLRKVDLRVIEPWISKQITEILNFEDDIVIGMVANYLTGFLEDPMALDPRKMQIDITGFLERKSSSFMKDLWVLLLEAQLAPNGIPKRLITDRQKEYTQIKEELRDKQQKLLSVKQKLEKTDPTVPKVVEATEKNIDKALKQGKTQESGISQELKQKLIQDIKKQQKYISQSRSKSSQSSKSKRRKHKKSDKHKKDKKKDDKRKSKFEKTNKDKSLLIGRSCITLLFIDKEAEVKALEVHPSRKLKLENKSKSRSRSRQKKDKKSKKSKDQNENQKYSYLKSDSSSSSSSNDSSSSSDSD